MSRGGRRAALPGEGWQPPERVIAGSGGTAVRFIEQSGRSSKVFDFGSMPVEPGLQHWLARAFASRTGPRSAVTRLKSAEQIFMVIRLFAGVVADTAGKVRGPQDLTAAHVTAFRLRHAGLRSGWGYFETLRSALRDEPGLPGTVRVALLSGQRPHRSGDDTSEGTVAYRDEEAQLIMTALRRDVRTARDRIRAGRESLARYRAGRCAEGGDEQRTGYLLDVFDRTGRLPRYPSGQVLAPVREAGGVAGVSSSLCLTLHEMTAFALLLTALTGENFGTVAAWPATCHRPDGGRAGGGGVALVEQVKPRRGPEREHMVAALEDADDLPSGLREAPAADGGDRLFRSPLRLYMLLIELTEVSRRHGGHTCAFSAFTPYRGRHGTSPWVEGAGAHHVRRWAGDRGFPATGAAEEAGRPAVSVRRLRQTVIEQRRRPVSHTRQTMNDHYLMRSGTVQADSRTVVGAALRDEVGKARAVQRIPMFTAGFLARAVRDPQGAAAEAGLEPEVLSRLTSGEQDTVLASCIDHLAGPRTPAGQPCTASFLACLDCENARALPHQLPVQIAAADTITALRAHLDPALWRVRYESRLHQLSDIQRAYTTEERVQARSRISDHHHQMLADLLDGKWDLR